MIEPVITRLFKFWFLPDLEDPFSLDASKSLPSPGKCRIENVITRIKDDLQHLFLDPCLVEDNFWRASCFRIRRVLLLRYGGNHLPSLKNCKAEGSSGTVGIAGIIAKVHENWRRPPGTEGVLCILEETTSNTARHAQTWFGVLRQQAMKVADGHGICTGLVCSHF